MKKVTGEEKEERMKIMNRFETVMKLICWIAAVILAWMHVSIVAVIALALVGTFGSEVDLSAK